MVYRNIFQTVMFVRSISFAYFIKLRECLIVHEYTQLCAMQMYAETWKQQNTKYKNSCIRVHYLITIDEM